MRRFGPLLVVLALVVLVGGWFASAYNRLVTGQTEVRNTFAEVDNQLKRRNDLIPNLVETVKGFAAQERAVFGAIAAARAQMAGARSPAQTIQAGQAMDSALGRLLVVVENYPQLRSNENFMALQDEIAGTENRLAVARRRYNDTVRDFNLVVKRFPGNLFGGLFGFPPEPYYETTSAGRQGARVNFGDMGSGG